MHVFMFIYMLCVVFEYVGHILEDLAWHSDSHAQSANLSHIDAVVVAHMHIELNC